MANTVSEQTRQAITLSGVPQFQIDAQVLAAGDLPTKAIFVIEIVDPSDSKEDLFARVAEIADFTDIGEDRITAVDNDAQYYRAISTTFFYPDVATADNAQKTLKDRIDELVKDNDLYLASFEATNEQTVHPTTGNDVYTAAVTDYVEARAARVVAEGTRDDAEQALVDATAAAADASAELILAENRSEACAVDKQAYDDMLTAFSLLKSQADLYAGAGQAGAMISSSNTFSAESAALEAASYTFKAAADLYRTALNAYNFTMDAAYDAASGVYNAALADYAGSVATFNGAITAFNANTDAFLQNLVSAQASLTAATAAQAVFAANCASLDQEYADAQTAKNDADIAVENARTAFADAQSAVASAQAAENAALAEVQALKPDFDPGSV